MSGKTPQATRAAQGRTRRKTSDGVDVRSDASRSKHGLSGSDAANNGISGREPRLTDNVPPSRAAGATAVTPADLELRLSVLLEACRQNLRSCDEELIRRALYTCVDAHKFDKRASGEPYFTHPYEVALIVAREVPLDDVSVAAALLHDVVEDTRYTVENVRDEFGSAIADIVDGATKITDVFNSHEVTQAASYRKLLLSMVNDVRVILIKFADRLHNMRTLQHLSPQKQQRMARETLDIFAPFAHRFGLGNVKWELEDLAFKYINPDIYNQIKKELKAKRKQREEYIERCVQPVRQRLIDEGFTFDIKGRAKHLYSIYQKMVEQGKSVAEIHDLIAIRIILDTEQANDCFTVYGVISEIYTPVPERFKNYISVPKKNGYQSIHTTVIGPEGRQVEVQIRTSKMHEIAERGVAAHFIYKEAKASPLIAEDHQLEEWINWIRDIFERAGDDTAPAEVLESFRLILFQDEIYVFTPAGELKILPKGATPVDFAFDVHSKVGYHCIGAKVNGRIVPLDTELKSGDQVEILTSKNQRPSADWEKFAVTHKARSGVRKFFKEEKRTITEKGKELWEKRARKEKLHVNDDELDRIAHQLRFEHRSDLWFEVGIGRLAPDTAVAMVREQMRSQKAVAQEKPVDSQTLYAKFLDVARTETGELIVDGTLKGLKCEYARCCNPIPGDQVIGIVTTGKGVAIHRITCNNVRNMLRQPRARNKALDVSWARSDGFEFMAGIRVTGEDRPGLLNDVTHAILSCQSTNIRSVNIASHDSLFEGTVMVMVKHIEHLNHLIERLRKIPNVKNVDRFEGAGGE